MHVNCSGNMTLCLPELPSKHEPASMYTLPKSWGMLSLFNKVNLNNFLCYDVILFDKPLNPVLYLCVT